MDAVLRRPGLTTGLLAVSLVGWVVAVQSMRGMDAGPGTDLGAFGWFLGVWVTMMAAMMLPAETPFVATFASLKRDAPPAAFVAGYLLVWTGYGVVAYLLYRLLHAVAPAAVAWDERGPWVAGGALALAGIYQLTPLKTACLRHCRAPVGFVLRGGRGIPGAVRIGAHHGAYCVGCCAGLMLALFALGVMSLTWMAVVAAAILVEKTLTRGPWPSRALAVALVAAGIWVAAAPGTVPGLVEPGGPAEMKMEMEMTP